MDIQLKKNYAHDSVTIKNIDADVPLNIYKTYASLKNKQIFTVIDKITSNKTRPKNNSRQSQGFTFVFRR